ncbi:MAG: hypothetical protein WCK02_00110 [Bacteroidota bacterium]
MKLLHTAMRSLLSSFFFLILFSQVTLAQGFLEVSGFVENDRTPLGECDLFIFSGGKKIEIKKSDVDGKFSLRLPLNNDYTLEVGKSGFVSKRFRFNTQIPATEKTNKIFVFELVTDLFERLDNIDYSALNQPLLIAEYSVEEKDFTFDMNHALEMDEKVYDIELKTVDFQREKRRYEDEILKADNLYATNQLEKAKQSYIKANKIKINEQYPKDKITEIDKLIAAGGTLDSYSKAILEADNFFKTQKFENAKTSYQKAISIKNTEQYPKSKIIEIDNILNSLAKQEENYKKAIAEADLSFNGKEYERAKANYQKALSFKANQKYPIDKVTEINGILSQIAAKKQQYDKIIALADNLFAAKDYNKAKEKYNAARKILPDEPYPANQLNEIDKLTLQMANIGDSYKNKIADADKLYNLKDYENAKLAYQNASNIKPSEQYPKEKINQINDIFAKNQQQKQSYDNAVSNADAMFNNKNYEKSKELFNTALSIFPNETYPKNKIEQINTILSDTKSRSDKFKLILADADALLAKKDYASAKQKYQDASIIIPEDKYPQQKINEINSILALQETNGQNYYKAISEGDNYLSSKNYDKALSSYKNASSIKPSENYPQQKINEISAIITKNKATKELYDSKINNANLLFTQKDYIKAKEIYNEASNILPDEKLPKDKISEINNLLNTKQNQQLTYNNTIKEADVLFSEKNYKIAKEKYLFASQTKTDENYPKNKIAEIDKIVAEQMVLDNTYSKAISDAEYNLKINEFEKAKQLFADAASLKPEESYPKTKIEEINKTVATTQTNKIAFDKVIAEADQLFIEQKYDLSKQKYTEASNILANEKYPKDRITEINNILTFQQNTKQLYTNYINEADKLLTSNILDKAKASYIKALDVKPDEQYPKDKIDEIEKKIIDIAVKSRDSQYQVALNSADSAFNAKNMNLAKSNYIKASKLKPEQKYPLDKITEINASYEKEQGVEMMYKDAISKADKFFGYSKFDLALKSYQDASKIKPNEQYPKDKIKESYSKMAVASKPAAKQDDRPEIELVSASTLVAKQKDTKFSFAPVAKKNNCKVILKIKNNTGAKNQVYFYYGEDDKKGGGFVFVLSEDKLEHEYSINVSEHMKWKTIANNWISVYSESGNFEVTSVKIIQN